MKFMKYMVITGDNRITDAVQLPGAASIIRSVMEQDVISKRDGIVHIDVKSSSRNEYVDYIESPVPIVSTRLQQLLLLYDANLFFKPVALLDQANQRQEMYWLLIPDRIDCLSEASKLHPNKTLKHLVIDIAKIGSSKFFQVDGLLETVIVIRLDVAESMLRRGFTGYRLQRVDSHDCLSKQASIIGQDY
ncbi:hypothetical protein [Paenibacillus popilliae]|uniref:Serine protease n=1 Tax=Paenibacillus popilliae TaxID=78057 RepID=A0ABY3APL8_PAEPP|nr:hypothetical protein [Paenibacillus sp. SDF0028]TQR41803.1 hypothetical protein C7Y44_25145 [Paenibacillus sp. SDF0028]